MVIVSRKDIVLKSSTVEKKKKNSDCDEVGCCVGGCVVVYSLCRIESFFLRFIRRR